MNGPRQHAQHFGQRLLAATTVRITAVIIVATLLQCLPAVTASCRGCVELDELTFDRVLNRYPDGALVKFDIAYPYGEKQDAFEKFATEMAGSLGGPGNRDLLIGVVGIKDYGDKDNQVLAKRFGVSEKYPEVYLFRDGANGRRTRFPATEPFTVENLKQFVRRNSRIDIGLAGCAVELDALARQLVESLELSEGDRVSSILVETQKRVAQAIAVDPTDRVATAGPHYMRLMEMTVEKGIEFVSNEQQRVQHLLAGKVSDNKRKELEQRLNILASFKSRGSDRSDEHIAQDEL